MALERAIPRTRKRRKTPSAASAPRVLGYLRVSTADQLDGYGMEAQRHALEAERQARGWTDIQWIEDGGYSAATLDRPGLTMALDILSDGGADILLAAKLDRLSRSSLGFATLCEQARQQGWALRVLDVGLDMSSSEGELMAAVIAAFSAFERRRIGERTSAALRRAAARGVRIGRPVELPEAVRADVVAMRSTGLSYAAIAARLNERNIPSARGSRWHPGSVHSVLHRSGSAQDETGRRRDDTGGSGRVLDESGTEWATHDANGRSLIYPGRNGQAMRDGEPVR